MADAVYGQCALTSATSAVLLFRLFWQHRSRATRLALSSSVSFAWFAASNLLVFADLVVLRTGHLAVARAGTACVGAAVLLVGLIWETE
jgi:hypothetical protein